MLKYEKEIANHAGHSAGQLPILKQQSAMDICMGNSQGCKERKFCMFRWEKMPFQVHL